MSIYGQLIRETEDLMMAQTETFDSDELLHLAIHATNKDETEKAISYLKRSIDIDANNAKVLYMLASLHAQIGMYERAIKGMREAINIDPELDTAHFQLGLLELTSGNVDNAKEVWSTLDKLDETHYLRVFRDALLLLIEDKLDDSVVMLQKGIMLNKENAPLNTDMNNFILEIEKNKAITNQQVPAQAEANKTEDEGKRILSAYQSDFNN